MAAFAIRSVSSSSRDVLGIVLEELLAVAPAWGPQGPPEPEHRPRENVRGWKLALTAGGKDRDRENRGDAPDPPNLGDEVVASAGGADPLAGEGDLPQSSGSGSSMSPRFLGMPAKLPMSGSESPESP